MTTSRPLLLVAVALTLCVAPATAGAAAAKGKGGGPCPSEKKSGKKISVTNQVYCWVQHERKSRRLPAYKKNKKLAKVAAAHSKRMEKLNVFNHEVGGTVFERISKTGYFKGAKSFGVGETITWAMPGQGARAAVDNWLHSSFHKSIMLSQSLKDFGIGVVKGSPYAGRSGGYTVTGVYAKRR